MVDVVSMDGCYATWDRIARSEPLIVGKRVGRTGQLHTFGKVDDE